MVQQYIQCCNREMIGQSTSYYDKPMKTDHHVKEKDEGKIDEYINLAADVRRQFMMKKVILPTVLGVLGTVPAKLPESLEKLQTSVLISQLDSFLV